MKKSLHKLFAMAAVSLMSLSAWAVMPEAGKVYRIVNKNYGTAVADNGPTGYVGCTAVNETSNSQRWVVSAGTNGTLRFRSLGTGAYLTSSRARSSAWSVNANPAIAAAQLEVYAIGSDYGVRAKGDDASLAMHCDGQSVVVCWSDNIDPSKWSFTEIPMTQAEIDEALAAFQKFEDEINKQSAYATALDALFSDKACTTLKANYQSMTDAQIQADSNYKALSATLQKAVLKAKNGNWAETCSFNGKSYDWDSEHAKKYRVQLYEPYSEGEASAVMAGIQAYTNVNNPSGIVGNSGDILYVMVEGEVKDGATLYLTPMVGAGMFNNTRQGVELHPGLNVVPIYSDQAHQLVNYTITTTTVDANGNRVPVKGRELNKYSDLKIHIEGGQLNGFYDYLGDALYTPDTRADFDYTTARATFQMYNLIGRYVILHLFLEDTPSDVGVTNLSWGLKSVLNPEINRGNNKEYDPAKIMKAWDDLCFRERTLMGIQRDEELLKYNDELLWGYYEPLTGDKIEKKPATGNYNTDPGFQYGDYFNNRMMGITMQGGLYMNATWWRTAYNISTLNDILCMITKEAGPVWGPAHEYGHMNQGPMKMAGTTEESNNVFSNVCVFYTGKATSRADMPSDQLRVFNSDGFYLENSTWGTTRMFLQLWLYYHACGNNKKFYPRLYELLRKNPLQHPYYMNVRYDHAHFVRMACLAAQEDLTDYFESWGFFRELDNYHIGDYSNNYATFTKKDIEAVKAEIKSWGLPVNRQIILIDDRPGSERPDWADYMSKSKAGKFGGLNDFRNKIKASGSFKATLRNDSLVITGQGNPGVGFLMYDENDQLLSFTNDYACPLKKSASAAMMKGTAKIYAIGADGGMIPVENDYRNRPISEHITNLRTLMAACADVHDVIDPTESFVGWYIPTFISGFTVAYDAAAAATESNTIDEVANLYLNLLDEYNKAKANKTASVGFVKSSTYQVISASFPTYCLSSTSSKIANTKIRGEGEDDTHQQWLLTASGDGYTLKNVKWNVYVKAGEKKGEELKVTADKSQAAVFHLQTNNQNVKPGMFVLSHNGTWDLSLHILDNSPTGTLAYQSGGWADSKWYLKIKEKNANYGAQSDLQRLIVQAQMLMDQAGRIGVEADPIEITAEQLYSNAPQKSGEGAFTGYDVLLDGDVQTFFQTNTKDAVDSEDGLDHYIRVDLGENGAVNSLQAHWTNRDVLGGDLEEGENTPPVLAPVQFQIAGSNDGTTWTNIVKITGLPSGNAKSYTTGLITDGKDYRYYRFMNVAGSKKACGHPYFGLSEFGVAFAEERATVKDIYPNVTGQMLYDIQEAIATAQKVCDKNGQSAAKYTAAKDALQIPYNVLAAAMGIASIDEIQANAPANIVSGIYDLQGRRYNKATPGNIYIINGQKILVK